jgi:hypothetical protein
VCGPLASAAGLDVVHADQSTPLKTSQDVLLADEQDRASPPKLNLRLGR